VVGGAGGNDDVDGVCEFGCDGPTGVGVEPVSGDALPETDVPEVPASDTSEGVVLLLPPPPPPQETSKVTAARAEEKVRKQFGKKEAVCKSISFWQ
jgi:hypothetical protein